MFSYLICVLCKSKWYEWTLVDHLDSDKTTLKRLQYCEFISLKEQPVDGMLEKNRTTKAMWRHWSIRQNSSKQVSSGNQIWIVRPHKKQITFSSKDTRTKIATTLSTSCTIKHICTLTLKLLEKKCLVVSVYIQLVSWRMTRGRNNW